MFQNIGWVKARPSGGLDLGINLLQQPRWQSSANKKASIESLNIEFYWFDLEHLYIMLGDSCLVPSAMPLSYKSDVSNLTASQSTYCFSRTDTAESRLSTSLSPRDDMVGEYLSSC